MLPANTPNAGSILVVEDDDDARDALCQLLRSQGYEPVAAADGKEALRCLRRIRPDLIVTDLSMPVMNGWQLVQHVRKHPEWRKIPLIVLSAESPPALDDLCFLQKPVPAARLLGAIAAQVSGPIHGVADSPAA